MKYKRPELIAPAGDWPALSTALASGADAVYFGIKDLNMRQGAGNFDILEIKKVISAIHQQGKQGYLTLNTIIYNSDIKKIKQILAKAKKAGVDAVVLWDMAVLEEARAIGLPVHLSTQASVANFSALKFYHSLGVKRIVLARECRLADIQRIIKNIKKEKLDCEIEVFIHGALCLSVSGRCLLSHYSFSKVANRGECIQPCRREFLIKENRDGKEYVLGHDFLLSPRDLCTIDFIDKLIKSGISAFKIEGRGRSAEYVGEVTSVYKQAIDQFLKGGLGPALKKTLKEKLALTYNRGFTDGFFFEQDNQTGSKEGTSGYNKTYVGKIGKFYKKISVAEVRLINAPLKKGQNILVFGKTTPAQVATVEQLRNRDRAVINFAEKGELIAVKLPFRARPGDKVFLYELK